MDESKKKDRYEDAKKFVRYSDGAKMYSMGMTKFQEVPTCLALSIAM